MQPPQRRAAELLNRALVLLLVERDELDAVER